MTAMGRRNVRVDRFDAAMIAEYLLALEDAAGQAGKPEAICGRLINRH
jgi:hypothetical protein